MITSLDPGQIFVFGSNEAGRHGKGAALTALRWGAIYGVSSGMQGQTYAIPTKDRQLRTLPLHAIRKYVVQFLDFARHQHYLQFLVTRIGCGLAGYEDAQIAPMFKTATRNVVLPYIWNSVLRRNN